VGIVNFFLDRFVVFGLALTEWVLKFRKDFFFGFVCKFQWTGVALSLNFEFLVCVCEMVCFLYYILFRFLTCKIVGGFVVVKLFNVYKTNSCFFGLTSFLCCCAEV
jgi:hypothetical protein